MSICDPDVLGDDIPHHVVCIPVVLTFSGLPIPLLDALSNRFRAGAGRRFRARALKTLTDFFTPWPRLEAAPGVVLALPEWLRQRIAGAVAMLKKIYRKVHSPTPWRVKTAIGSG